MSTVECQRCGLHPEGYLLADDGQTDVADIVAEVARGFNVTFGDIIGDSRRYHIVKARKTAMAVIRELTDLSYPAIGELFGKDHTTVMHHVASVKADPQRARAVALVVQELTGRTDTAS
jgi:chromosomal replication initiator protein